MGLALLVVKLGSSDGNADIVALGVSERMTGLDVSTDGMIGGSKLV